MQEAYMIRGQQGAKKQYCSISPHNHPLECTFDGSVFAKDFNI